MGMLGLSNGVVKTIKCLHKNGRLCASDIPDINPVAFAYAVKKLLEYGIIEKKYDKNGNCFYDITSFGRDLMFVLEWHQKI